MMEKQLAREASRLKINRKIFMEKNDVHGDNKQKAMKPVKLKLVSASEND